MVLLRLVALCCALLAILAACSKEPAAPKAPPGGTLHAPPASAPAAPPAAAPGAPAAPAESPPTTSSSSAPAGNDDKAMLALASKDGCLACHSVDNKMVGPAWKDVAAKYRGQADAEAKLIQKVKNGGQGVWGSVPMPPNTQVKDEDVKSLVDWVLKLK